MGCELQMKRPMHNQLKRNASLASLRVATHVDAFHAQLLHSALVYNALGSSHCTNIEVSWIQHNTVVLRM